LEFYDCSITRPRYFDEEEIGAYAGGNNSEQPIPAIEISKSRRDFPGFLSLICDQIGFSDRLYVA
jgi:hypothetical protein